MTHSLQPLVDPASIAILGASANPQRLGGVPIVLLQKHGFKGEIYPINPKYPEIAGLTCYPDIASLPGSVDVLIIAVAASEVVTALKDASAKGIRAAVIFAAGYAEQGDAEGQALQEELKRHAQESGILVAGPNCMGFANLDIHAYSTFTSVYRTVEPPVGPRDVALITQSGSVSSAVYAAGRSKGVQFSVVINTGNEACVEFSQYMEYLAGRPGTQAILGYVEGLRDGDNFCKVAATMRDRGQLMSVLKVGDTEKGASAAASHTAAIAGQKGVYQAVFERLCVVPANDIEHLADMGYMARFRKKDSGRRVAILSISGAMGALLSDQFIKAGVQVPTLNNEIQSQLRTEIPQYGMVANPVDLTGNIMNRHSFVADALTYILDDNDVDFAVVYAPGFLIDRMTDAVSQVANAQSKLIAVIATGDPTRQDELERVGVPVFDNLTRAVAALSSLATWHENLQKYAGRPLQDDTADVQRLTIDTTLEPRNAENGTQLNEHHAKQLLAQYGIPVVAEHVVHDSEQAARIAAEIGYPVVMKVLSADITHKTELGAVALNLNSSSEVISTFDRITSNVRRAAPDARIEGVLVQEQVEAGIELLLSVTKDPTFGPVLSVAFGGVWVELLNDIAQAPLPLTQSDATALLKSLRAWPLLDGFRGSPQVNIGKITDSILKLADLAHALQGDLDVIEINPLRVYPDKVVAVDAVIRVATQRKHVPCAA